MPPANKRHMHTHQTVSLLIAFSNFNIFIVCGMVMLHVIWEIIFIAWICWLMPTDSFFLRVCWRLMAPIAELWWLLTMRVDQGDVLPHLLWPPAYPLSYFSLQGQQGETIRQSQPRKVPKHNITVNNNTYKHHKQFIRVIWGPHTSKKPLKDYSEGLFPYEQCLFSCSLMCSLPALSHLHCLTRSKKSVGSVSRVSLKFCQQL